MQQNKYASLFPTVRKAVANTIGLNLVPTVPMSGPTGLMPFMDISFGWENRVLGRGKHLYPRIVKIQIKDSLENIINFIENSDILFLKIVCISCPGISEFKVGKTFQKLFEFPSFSSRAGRLTQLDKNEYKKIKLVENPFNTYNIWFYTTNKEFTEDYNIGNGIPNYEPFSCAELKKLLASPYNRKNISLLRSAGKYNIQK